MSKGQTQPVARWLFHQTTLFFLKQKSFLNLVMELCFKCEHICQGLLEILTAQLRVDCIIKLNPWNILKLYTYM